MNSTNGEAIIKNVDQNFASAIWQQEYGELLISV